MPSVRSGGLWEEKKRSKMQLSFNKFSDGQKQKTVLREIRSSGACSGSWSLSLEGLISFDSPWTWIQMQMPRGFLIHVGTVFCNLVPAFLMLGFGPGRVGHASTTEPKVGITSFGNVSKAGTETC